MQRRDDPHVGPSPPTAGKRRRVDVFIAVFVLFHLITPLRYYSGDGGDDERFSWRMFSSVYADQQLRMQSCRAAAGEEGVGEIPLATQVSSAWTGYFTRGRRDAVDGYLRWQCRRTAAGRVWLEIRCRPLDGRFVPSTRTTIDCRTGRMETSEIGTWEPGSETGTVR